MAALCAALTARAAGASVLLLESAPRHFRGGNSRHTRNLRCMHDGPSDPLSGAYPAEEYWRDLQDVTGGRTNEALARMVIAGTADCRTWMAAHGVRFQPSIGGALHLAHTNAFFLGGGKALVNAYYRAAARLGVDVVYDAEVRDLQIENGRFEGAVVARNGHAELVPGAYICRGGRRLPGEPRVAQGRLGRSADNFLIRGTPYDTGRVLRALMDGGAATTGDPTQCHAVAIDARAPRFDGGIVTRVDCIPAGHRGECPRRALPRRGRRPLAETLRRVGTARGPAAGPDGVRHLRTRARSDGSSRRCCPRSRRRPSAASPPRSAWSRPRSSARHGLQRGRAPGHVRRRDARRLRHGRTHAAKSHWARRIDRAPFYAYPLRPGITFTYLGVQVDERARVIWQDGRPAANVFAAGEIMAGNILGQGYLAGIGMAIGTVFGRKAGEEAARHVRN